MTVGRKLYAHGGVEQVVRSPERGEALLVTVDIPVRGNRERRFEEG